MDKLFWSILIPKEKRKPYTDEGITLTNKRRRQNLSGESGSTEDRGLFMVYAHMKHAPSPPPIPGAESLGSRATNSVI